MQSPWDESVPGMFKQAERPVWLELRQWGVRKCGRRCQRGNGEPDHVCPVGHQKDFVFSSQ